MKESCIVFCNDYASRKTLSVDEASVVSSGGGSCVGSRTKSFCSPLLTVTCASVLASLSKNASQQRPLTGSPPAFCITDANSELFCCDDPSPSPSFSSTLARCTGWTIERYHQLLYPASKSLTTHTLCIGIVLGQLYCCCYSLLGLVCKLEIRHDCRDIESSVG